MTTLTLKRLEELDQAQTGVGLSVYCPLDPGPNGAQKNRTRLKNLLSRARSQLRSSSLEQSEVERVLERCPEQAEVLNSRFSGTLALFVTPESSQSIEIPVRLEQRVCTGYHYLSLRPLVTALSRHYQYFALSMSEKRVELYFGDWSGGRKIPNPERLPTSLEEVRGETRGPLFSHPSVQGNSHGHSPTNRLELERHDRFLATIAGALMEIVKPQIPLVLMGVQEWTAPLAQSMAERTVIEIHGNYDHLKADQIHSMVAPRVKEIHRQRRQEELSRWAVTPPRLRTHGLEHSLFAAQAGAVKTLLVQVGNPMDMSSEMERSLEEIAMETLRHGGEVLALEHELESNPLATLRYALTFPRRKQDLEPTHV